MKFLVMWELERVHSDTVQAVTRMPQYAAAIKQQGKLLDRFHIVGRHGGAWIYDVASNEELEHLLAMSPVYNYSRYQVYPLADMQGPADVLRPND